MDSSALSAEFDRSGFTVVRAVLDTTTISFAQDHRRRIVSRLGLAPDAPIVAALPDDTDANELASDPRLIGLACGILGTSVRCFGLSYLTKPPHAGLPTHWHQDAGPWAGRLGGADALTVWIALTDADEDNGGLSVVPASHHLSAQPLRPDTGEPSLFGVGMDRAFVDEERARSINVTAGDAVVLHQNLVHGAEGNHSARGREALSVRYCADAAIA